MTLGISSCIKNKTPEYIPYPPKPSTYGQFNEIVEYFDNGKAEYISNGPKPVWATIGYSLMLKHDNDTIYSSYLDAIMTAKSEPNATFTDTWLYKNWDSFAHEIKGDWSNFDFIEQERE